MATPEPGQVDSVSELVLKVCEGGGRIPLKDAVKSPIKASAARQRPFAISKDQRGQEWVKLNVDGLKLCGSHCTKEGCSKNCGSLHLCKYFLLSSCSRTNCKFGHDVASYHNRFALSQYEFGDISLDALKAIVKLNRTDETLPAVCKFYNNEGGCDNPLQGKNACTYLHICRHFLTGDCKFGRQCKRSHNFVGSKHSMNILDQYGITGTSNGDIVQSLTAAATAASRQQAASSSRRSSSSSSFSRSGSAEPPSPPAQGMSFTKMSPRVPNPILPKASAPMLSARDRPPGICTYNLVGKCSYGQECRNHHSKLPYQWQLEDDIGQWQNCQGDLNLALEENFCKPNTANAKLLRDQEVDFSSMTITTRVRSWRLRRLETISTAVCETRQFATEWQWYWLDDDDKWILYGQQGSSGARTNTDSFGIEKSYQDFIDGSGLQELKFKTHSFDYIMDFKQLNQTNLKTLIQRPIFRRPFSFITEATVAEMKRQRRRPGTSFSLPVEWTALRGSDERYQLDTVRKGTPEYLKVANPFIDSLKEGTVQKIERIQNPDLWEEYSRMKEKFKVKQSGNSIGEMLLFHGTGEDKINAICQQGFDPRVAGISSGTVYGRGSYFSSSAAYSERYCRGSNKMIVAQVLVGEYTKGKSEYTRPPPRNPDEPFGELYDSVVNDCDSPAIYVLFDGRQIYPNYIIHYSSMADLTP